MKMKLLHAALVLAQATPCQQQQGKHDKKYPHYNDYPGAIYATTMAEDQVNPRGAIAWFANEIGEGAVNTVANPKPDTQDLNAVLQGGEGSNVFEEYLESYEPTDNDRAVVAKFLEWMTHKNG